MNKFGSILVLFLVAGNLAFTPGNSKNKKSAANGNTIVNEKDGITFSFALLNSEGKPAVKFQEGENFSFNFKIENNRKDSLFIDNAFLLDNNGFCAVYDEKGKLVGAPYEFSGAYITGPEAHPLFGAYKQFDLTIPWSDARAKWSTLHCSFKGTNQHPLPKGKYFTTFKQRFCLNRNVGKPSICTENLTFKINFEVE